MARTKYRHLPQGTTSVTSSDKEEKIAEWRLEQWGKAQEQLPYDPEIDALSYALVRRNDREIRRLIPILKARYGKVWAEIGRDILIAVGRSPGGRRR